VIVQEGEIEKPVEVFKYDDEELKVESKQESEQTNAITV